MHIVQCSKIFQGISSDFGRISSRKADLLSHPRLLFPGDRALHCGACGVAGCWEAQTGARPRAEWGVRVSSSGEQIVLLGGLHTLPGIIVIALADSEDQTQVERLACLAFSL